MRIWGVKITDGRKNPLKKLRTRLKRLLRPKKPRKPKKVPISLEPIPGKPPTPRQTPHKPAGSARSVNMELSRHGYSERLQTDRKGLWWFSEGLSGNWASVEVPGKWTISDHSVMEWVEIRNQLAHGRRK